MIKEETNIPTLRFWGVRCCTRCRPNQTCKPSIK